MHSQQNCTQRQPTQDTTNGHCSSPPHSGHGIHTSSICISSMAASLGADRSSMMSRADTNMPRRALRTPRRIRPPLRDCSGGRWSHTISIRIPRYMVRVENTIGKFVWDKIFLILDPNSECWRRKMKGYSKNHCNGWAAAIVIESISYHRTVCTPAPATWRSRVP